MPAIFYDLETSDRRFVGQILNYSFIAVDDRFQPIGELSGLIRISRLQLPSPEALLANRTNVIEHQSRASDSERDAAQKIVTFIREICDTANGKVPLIGYNSSRFDLPFLRTTLIRNGLNPYFDGKVISRDLLFCSKRLAALCEDFPRVESLRRGEAGKLSLSLEALCKHFKLLDGCQAHESRADVLLTIELARIFRDRFGLDVTKYEAYEVPPCERGTVLMSVHPGYDLSGDRRSESPLALLDADHRSALWIDLSRYKPGSGRSCVSWYSRAGHYLFAGTASASAEHRSLAKKALEELKNVSLRNYFSVTTCDIEQDIYRVDFDSIAALSAAIWERDATLLRDKGSPDARVLYDRHRIANYTWGSGKDEKVEEMLRAYARYRYGGAMQVLKYAPRADEAGNTPSLVHETFAELLHRIDELSTAAGESDRGILDALRRFYFDSDIFRLAGAELNRPVDPQMQLIG